MYGDVYCPVGIRFAAADETQSPVVGAMGVFVEEALFWDFGAE